MGKHTKKEKESNLKLSLAAAFFLLALFVFCLIDELKNATCGGTSSRIFMIVFFSLCAIGLVWMIFYIIRQIKSGKK